ncbi:MAG: hypothetical protein JO257_35995 [Deltaproteobacteria bacterium]|nr:hypothetical protein [Deltaproteobacteria bacterium]
MRRLAWLVMLGACGKDASPPAQPPVKAPVKAPAVVAPPVNAVEDSADTASRRRPGQLEDEMRRKPVPPRALTGELMLGGKMVDVTTLSPMFDVATCDPARLGAQIVVHAANARMLEIDVEGHADRAGAIALFRDDDTHEHHGIVYAHVTAYATDASGKQRAETATKGKVVVHQLGAQVDVSIDAVFGTAGRLAGRFVADPPFSRGPCVVE